MSYLRPYSLGSLATNRRFSSVLSAATRRRVLSIDYRLAPEHRFPAALDDDMPHVWHMFAGALPEADRAIEAIGRWLARLEPQIQD